MISIPQPVSINPYESIQSMVVSGLDTMIAEFTGPLTVDQLSLIVGEYLQSQFYPSGDSPGDQEAQLYAIVGNVFNAYVEPNNPVLHSYSPLQRQFIEQLISFAKTESINIVNVVTNNSFEEAFATSSLTTTEQAQLYILTSILGGVYEYLYAQILSPDANWSPYLDPDPAVNFSNLPNWMVATIRGTMIGMVQSVSITPTNAPQGTGLSVNLITALGGAFTGVFGEVLYNWAGRPHTSC